jgi:CheY-like chemotaxis protein
MINRTPPGLLVLRTVVIADDEPSMRLLVHATIESDDYTVVEAVDGAQAWAMIQEHKPSLVLLDVQMPGLSGLEVLQLIEAGLIAGADFYLTKPFSPLDLLTRVEEALLL